MRAIDFKCGKKHLPDDEQRYRESSSTQWTSEFIGRFVILTAIQSDRVKSIARWAEDFLGFRTVFEIPYFVVIAKHKLSCWLTFDIRHTLVVRYSQTNLFWKQMPSSCTELINFVFLKRVFQFNYFFRSTHN